MVGNVGDDFRNSHVYGWAKNATKWHFSQLVIDHWGTDPATSGSVQNVNEFFLPYKAN